VDKRKGVNALFLLPICEVSTNLVSDAPGASFVFLYAVHLLSEARPMGGVLLGYGGAYWVTE
jgi:hypothetical protein